MNNVKWFFKGIILATFIVSATHDFMTMRIGHGFFDLGMTGLVFAMMIQDLKEEIQKER